MSGRCQEGFIVRLEDVQNRIKEVLESLNASNRVWSERLHDYHGQGPQAEACRDALVVIEAKIETVGTLTSLAAAMAVEKPEGASLHWCSVKVIGDILSALGYDL